MQIILAAYIALQQHRALIIRRVGCELTTDQISMLASLAARIFTLMVLR